MIGENSREAFLELIRPPANYKLKYCVGTTFSLELPCLIQLALNSKGRKEVIEDLTVFDGYELINEFAKNAVVFTQNCRIKALPSEIVNLVNTKKSRFFSLLDGIVEEVPIMAAFSAFHPKVWFIRFDNEQKGESIFKFFVMSRNLTTSLKWDISSCMVGKIGKKSKINDELVKFFKMLVKKSSLKGSTKKKSIINNLFEDLDNVEFELPRSQKKCEFSFKWGKEKKWVPIKYSFYSKLIIVSPFLHKDHIKELNEHPNPPVFGKLVPELLI